MASCTLTPPSGEGDTDVNLIELIKRFPDQCACIEYLESVRWKGQPHCPYCGSFHVGRKKEPGRVGRWNCYDCNSSFNVLRGTVMQGTRIPLQNWFMAIALMVNAKKSISSCQMARDLDMDQKTCWAMQKRIREAMASEEINLLEGILEADETYIGATPRMGGSKFKGMGNKNLRGRGTTKATVLGVVERDGNVVARLSKDARGYTILEFMSACVNIENSMLVSDGWRGYKIMAKYMKHKILGYRKGYYHTNTIEGFWTLLKRAWYGQHHHYSLDHMPLYIAEACWKYNNRYRDSEEVFNKLLETAMSPA